jgi:hypothetical protein
MPMMAAAASKAVRIAPSQARIMQAARQLLEA